MKRAFTLIELLVVVAIVAILASIAIANMLEAQARSKVSRSKADLRTFATAVEAYATDNNAYPLDILPAPHLPGPYAFYYWYLGYPLTTPVAYISSTEIPDPFRRDRSPDFLRGRYVNYALGDFNAQQMNAQTDLQSYAEGKPFYGSWRISYAGPDGQAGPGSPVALWFTDYPNWGRTNFPRVLVIYDPTNGSNSPGDIVRSQAQPEQRQDAYQ